MKAVYLFFPLLIFALMINSCSAEEYEKQVFQSNDDSESEVQHKNDDKAQEVADINQAENPTTVEGGEEGELDFINIASVKVESISKDSVRDGFRAIVLDTSGNPMDDIDISLIWKLNGEEITGEVEQSLPWQEEFKRGDIISVLVTPPDLDTENTIVPEGEFIIPNSPPKIVSEPPLEIKDGKFDYTVEAEDPDGEDVEFLLRKSPKGMTIEPASGLISWDFRQEKPGTEYKIEIVATDPDGLSYTQELTLTIPEQQPTSEGETEGQEEQ